jgi:hypothetical protein
MTFQRNAKLGLSGRFALVQAIEGGMSVRAAAGAFRLAGDRSPPVGPLARRRRGGHEARSSACATARAGRTALRAGSPTSCRRDLRPQP